MPRLVQRSASDAIGIVDHVAVIDEDLPARPVVRHNDRRDLTSRRERDPRIRKRTGRFRQRARRDSSVQARAKRLDQLPAPRRRQGRRQKHHSAIQRREPTDEPREQQARIGVVGMNLIDDYNLALKTPNAYGVMPSIEHAE